MKNNFRFLDDGVPGGTGSSPVTKGNTVTIGTHEYQQLVEKSSLYETIKEAQKTTLTELESTKSLVNNLNAELEPLKQQHTTYTEFIDSLVASKLTTLADDDKTFIEKFIAPLNDPIKKLEAIETSASYIKQKAPVVTSSENKNSLGEAETAETSASKKPEPPQKKVSLSDALKEFTNYYVTNKQDKLKEIAKNKPE